MSLNLPKIIGHRGLCAYAPENTLVSLRVAHDRGLQWVEFDVKLTADGEIIVMHDDKLNRTTSGRGLVAKTNYSRIAELDAGSWFDQSFAGEKVPTFAEYLKCAKDLGLGINIEIKPNPDQDIETAHRTVECLQQYWSDRSQLLVSSFSLPALGVVQALDETLPLALLTRSWFDGMQEALLQLNCVALNVKHSLLNRQRAQEIKQAGYQLLAFTVDDQKEADELYLWGVDAVFSNQLF